MNACGMRALRPLSSYRSHFALVVAGCFCLAAHHEAADGPGVPARTFTSGQVNTAIKTFTVGDMGQRTTFAGMSRGYLIVAGGGFGSDPLTNRRITLWNLADPFNPTRTASVQDDDLFKTHAMGFSGNLLTVRSTGFRVYDITDPAAPVLRGGTSAGSASSLFTFYAPPYLYRGGEGYGAASGWVSIFDVSNPNAPALLADIDMPTLVGFRCGAVQAIGNVLIVTASQTDGVVTMDISDPRNPRILNVLRNPGDVTYTALANGTRVYSGSDSGELYVYDFANKNQIQFVNKVALGGAARYPMIQDNFVHLGNLGNKRYQKVNVSNFTIAANVSVPDPSIDPEIAVPLGNMVFVGGSVGFADTAHAAGYLMVHQAAPDTTGPSVNAVRPLDAEVNVGLSTMIGISLTDQIDPRTLTSANFIVRPIGGAALPGTYSTQAGICNFVPAQNLAANTTYEVIVTAGGLKDLSGNGVPAQFRSTFSTGAAPAANNGLTHRWKLDGDVTDSVGSNNGINNGATFGAGHTGQAAYMDGADSITAGSINLGTEFSLAAWVWVNSGAANIQTVLANAIGGAATDGFKLFVNTYNTSDGKLILETGDGTNGTSAQTAAGAVPVNAWVHVVAVVNRQLGRARLYINSADSTVAQAAHTNFGINQGVVLGAFSGGGFPLNGRLDEVRIYNRELTQAEINTIYADVDDASMSHRWRLNGSAIDSVGSANGVVNSVTFGPGNEAEAGYFNRTGYIALGPVDLGDPFTITSWVWLNSSSTNIHTIIANAVGGAGSAGFKLFMNHWNSTDRALVLETGDGSAGASAQTANGIITPDTWVHVAAVINRAQGTARLYVNGADQTQSGGVVSAFPNNQGTYLGSFADQGFLLGGRIDDVHIYPRALTASEISNVYTNVDSSGLNHFYRLNGDASDSVGNNNGAVSGVTFATGHDGDAAYFNGSAFISLGTMNVGETMTFAGWVWVNTGANNIQTIFANGNSGFGNGFSLFVNSFNSSDGRLVLETSDGVAGASANTATGAVIPGAWNHVAAIINRTGGTARLFVNGADATSSSAVRIGFGNNQATYLGNFANGNFKLNGRIDEFRIYDRELSSSEITALYTGGANNPPVITALTSTINPVVVGANVTFNATASDPDGNALFYSFDFGDGTPPTAFSSSASAGHAYASAGRYTVLCSVRDAQATVSRTMIQIVHWPLTSGRPTHSTAILHDASRNKVWNVNPDNDSVTRINVPTAARDFELAVGKNPATLALRPGNAEIWVACEDADEIRVIDAGTGAAIATINTGYGSHPSGLVFSPDGANAFVTLKGRPRLAKYNPSTRAKVGEVALSGIPRAVAVSHDSTRVFVGRFISPSTQGEIWEVNPSTLALVRTMTLSKDTTSTESESSGRGLPNYIVQIGISPDGRRLWAPSKKDNIVRGSFRTGEALLAESTVRSIFSKIDLAANAEVAGERNDTDNHELPHGLVFSPVGDLAFIAYQGNNEVLVFDTQNNGELYGHSLGNERAPQGLAIDAAGTRLFVHNFLTRTVSILDISALVQGTAGTIATVATVSAIGTEQLSAQVLEGKRIFYNAADRRMSIDGYISCAACHLAGDNDGQVWDFTDRGEGLRNTIALKGHGGISQGRVHWTANFDEIQDFENDIRNAFAGTGFIASGTPNPPLGAPNAGRSAELDALSAFVSSLTTFGRSPYRNTDGSLTSDAVAGRALFAQLNCSSCHSGSGFTDSGNNLLHDVGTMKASSGKRLNALLTGLDTPSLKGLWETGPYLHDGSAATLLDVITTANAASRHGNTAGLTTTQQNQLVAFMQQIDDSEPAVVPGSGSLPANPESLGAAAVGDTQINLTWIDRASDETGFKIERKTGAGGTWSQIATVAANISSYNNTGLTAGTTYYYRVRAYNGAGDSAWSNDAFTSTASTAGLPAGWKTLNVGVVAAAGNASHAGGTYTIGGSGADIWNTSDSFRYVYRTASGNCEIRARVASLQNTDPWAKAGVMIRETLNGNSRHTLMCLTPENGANFQSRSATGGTSSTTSGGAFTAPYWVRIVRSNNTFTAYRSSNGSTWTQVGSQTITMANSVYIGLAVTSHNDGVVNTSTFDNVTAVP